MSSTIQDNVLGTYLRDCRARLDPTKFGFDSSRRRTPGLRREEVAQRASVSATWYTWLEQGRGGSPSTVVLDRLAHALALSEGEREHLFVLATGLPPAPSHSIRTDVSPRIQRVLDSMGLLSSHDQKLRLGHSGMEPSGKCYFSLLQRR